MMGFALPWWRDRTRREQWLLGVMAVLLVIVFVWLGILRPAEEARAAAQARHAAALTSLGEVKAMGAAIRVAEARGGAGVPVTELIGQRVRETGLTAGAIESSGDGRVTVRVAAVRPQVMLRWIAELEARDGVIVEHVSMTRNNDATVAVDLTLRARAA